ncbi:MAG: GNAT family N-acetyltransferase [Polyangiaceae bacterium]
MSCRFEFEAIHDLERAWRLEPEWTTLWERCPGAMPFVLPDWQLASWRNFGSDCRRALVCGRIDGSLVGVALFRERQDGELVLEGEECSDYQDLLAEPRAREHFAPSLIEWVRERTRTRRFSCERLPHGSAWLQMKHYLPFWSTKVELQDVCPFVPFPEGAGDLKTVVPSGFLRRVEQARRVAARNFDVCIVEADSSSWQTQLSELFRLHAERWELRGQSGVLILPEVREFHREVVPRLLARGRLRLLELRFDGRSAASLYALCAPRKVAYYVGGFAPEFARFSPGRLLLLHLFEDALRRGVTEIDFLRGVERYKYDWGARNRNTYRVTLQGASSP